MKNVASSVQARLKNHSRQSGVDMPTLYRRYVQERLIYRLSVSAHAEEFALKGGLLLAAYNGGDLERPTEDIDFNGIDCNGNVERLKEVLLDVISAEVPDDGVIFDAETMNVTKDRTGAVPGGKITMQAKVGTALVGLKVDVGFGNPVTPSTRQVEFPTLLDGISETPRMQGYPLETVIAEKLHAMVQFGIRNTRVKDHYDLYMLSKLYPFESDLIADAISTTFSHQQRELPDNIDGLGKAYLKAAAPLWKAFLAKLPGKPKIDFAEAVSAIKEFVDVPVADARTGSRSGVKWDPGNGWSAPAPRMR